MDDALRSFDGVLALKPTNVVALLGKARILYTRRQYTQSLRLFQEVLRLSPNCKPDPRIGIGLCFWALDHKAQAKTAWERSLEVVCPVLSEPHYHLMFLAESIGMGCTTSTWSGGDEREQK